MRDLAAIHPAARRRALRRRLRVRPAVLAAAMLALVALPAVAGHLNNPLVMCEFRYDLYVPARDVLRGHDPYTGSAYVESQAARKRAGRSPNTAFIVPVYPAPALVAAVPLGVLPFRVAELVFLLMSVSALAVALRLLGVRDVRCVAAMLLSVPVMQALMVGAMSPLLMLGIALAWRYRRGAIAPAAAVAAAVAAKLFLWPLMAWSVCRGRLRELSRSVLVAAVLLLVGWAAIGFAGLTSYPHLLRELSYVEEDAGVSVVAALHAAGVGSSAAHAIVWLLTAGLLAAAYAVARSAARRPDAGRRAFGLLVLAGLVASPIAWPSYFVLMFVPIALLSPRFSALWLVPLLAYLAPGTQTHGHLWAILPYVAIDAVVAVALLAPKRLRRRVAVTVSPEPAT